MSYHIQYGPKLPQERKNKRTRGLRTLIAAAILVVVFGLKTIFPVGFQQVQYALMPWTLPDTQATFWEMVESIQEGEGLQSAITAFCSQVLQQAELIS